MRVDRRYLLYAPVLFGASGLLFLKSLVYARLFPVESFGALNQAILIASTFAQFASAGLLLLAHKLLPQFHARGNQAAVDDLIGSATAVFGAAAAIAATAIGVSVLAGWLQSAATAYATLLYAVAQFLFMLRLIDVKSEMRFIDHALLSSLRALLLLSAGAAVAAITGHVAATLAAEGIVTLLIAAQRFTGTRGRPVLRAAFDFTAQRRWLAAHFPAALRLLLLNGIVTLVYAIDRWAGIALLSEREYGIFALGLLVILVFETLQAVINVPAFPLLGRMISQGQHQRAFRLAALATLAVIGVTAVCYAPFVWFLDFMVRGYLPLYVEATNVIKLAVIAGALRLADFFTTFIILCNEEQRLTWAFAAVGGIAVVGIVVLESSGYVRFNPDRLAMVTVGIAASAYLVNVAIAMGARRRHRALVPA